MKITITTNQRVRPRAGDIRVNKDVKQIRTRATENGALLSNFGHPVYFWKNVS